MHAHSTLPFAQHHMESVEFNIFHKPPWLLPTEATIVAWDSHPQGKRAFPRRTWRYRLRISRDAGLADRRTRHRPASPHTFRSGINRNGPMEHSHAKILSRPHRMVCSLDCSKRGCDGAPSKCSHGFRGVAQYGEDQRDRLRALDDRKTPGGTTIPKATGRKAQRPVLKPLFAFSVHLDS